MGDRFPTAGDVRSFLARRAYGSYLGREETWDVSRKVQTVESKRRARIYAK